MTLGRSVWIGILSTTIAWSQTAIDVKQLRTADFSGFSLTKPAQVGTALPSSCSTGQMFFKSNALAGANLYVCVLNSWSLQSGQISSIFGRTGDVQAASGDYQFGMIGGVASLLQGGTGATTAAQALINLGAAGLAHTHTADQIGNAVSTIGTYSNPNWITSISWSKLTGVPSLFAPSPHAATHQHGGTDEVGSLTVVPNGIPKADGDGKLSPAWLDLGNYQVDLGYAPLNPVNNLSELPDSDAARSNLGLGTAALKNAQGIGAQLPTLSGAFGADALPVIDSTGTQVDSGCSAANGALTCSSGSPSRIGVTKGTAPLDTALRGVTYDAVLFLDAADEIWKVRRSNGSVGLMGGTVDAGVLKNAGFCDDVSTSGNTITCTTVSGFSGYAAGQAVWVRTARTNTAEVKININANGAVNVTKNGATTLSPGDLLAGAMYLLLYDGTRFQLQIAGTSSGGSSVKVDCSDPANICLADTFLGSGVTSGTIGNLRWSTIGSGAAFSLQSGEAGHPGITGLATSSVANGIAGLDLPSSAKPIPALNGLTNAAWYWKFKTPADITEWEFSAGLTATSSSSNFADNGVHVTYSNNTGCTVTGTDTAFQFVTRGTGGAVAGAGLTPLANTWYWVKLYTTAAGTFNFQMKADGGAWSEALSASTAYTAGTVPYIRHGTCNTVSKLLMVDDFRFYQTGLN
jgi:hypothetical protein